MDKVILDTNILYSLAGLSPNNKVKNDLSSCYELWTTTAALIEGIVKYRNELTSIQKILTPVINEEIKLIRIGYVPLETEIIKDIYNANSLQDVAGHINEILNLKISKEAEFLRWFFVISVLGIFEILKEKENYTFSDPSKDRLLMQLVKALIEGNQQYLLEHFKDKIKEGYISGDEQRVVLGVFNDMLLSYINIFHFNYYQVESGIINNNKLGNSEQAIASLYKSFLMTNSIGRLEAI